MEWEIVDTMNYIKCPVSTICVGLAASFGAVLLANGEKGKRYATPNSEILIHQPLIGGQGGRNFWSSNRNKNPCRSYDKNNERN